MKYLSIDFGMKKVGLAVSEGKLAEPLSVIRYNNQGYLLEKLSNLVKDLKVEKIVIGLPEGIMHDRAKAFSSLLKEKTGIEPVFEDETLTTLEAQNYSLEAGLKQKKRRNMEDAFAASLILQNHLDHIK